LRDRVIVRLAEEFPDVRWSSAVGHPPMVRVQHSGPPLLMPERGDEHPRVDRSKLSITWSLEQVTGTWNEDDT